MKWSCVVATAMPASGHETPTPDRKMLHKFWMRYGKMYDGMDEESVRSDKFKDNFDVIRTTNAPNLSSGCAPPSSPT